jgi:hypothetical protein
MTWLYIPSPQQASPCAQASEDSISPFNSLAPDSEVSLTWRGKQAPLQAWSRRWKAGGFIRLLSGLTLQPSTADRGVASWISSLAAIRASQTASPESEVEPTTTVSLSIRYCELSMKSGLFVSSAKTCRGTRTDSLQPSSPHWSEWATALRQEYSARPKPATATGESDCSLWPTARANDSEKRGDISADARNGLPAAAMHWTTPSCSDPHRGGTITEAMTGSSLTQQVGSWATPRSSDTKAGLGKTGNREQSKKNRAGWTLSEQSTQWLTPNVPNGGRTTHHAVVTGKTAMHNGKKVQVGLESQAEKWSTPTARMHKGGSLTSLTRSDGKSRLDMLDMLDWQAEAWAEFQSLSPDLPTPDGQICCATDQTLPPPSQKRRLNPLFVEALMRWPTGLSGFDTAETVSTQWLEHMRTFVLMLFTAKQQAKETENFEQMGLFE